MIRAAGAVVWRPVRGGGVEIALVHRPRYDDWSLPKGKREPQEHPVAAAVRETAEETGQRVVLGRPLPTQHYETADGQKEVHYWSARALGGTFTPGEEVDSMTWLAPAQAARTLSNRSDLDVLAALLAGPIDTQAMIVLRHARAKARARWTEEDARRPLDAAGRRQAGALVAVLAAYRPTRVVSSPALRCLQTVGPFATATGIEIETAAGLAEDAPKSVAGQAREEAARLHAADAAVLLCTHRPLLPPLLRRLSGGGEPLASGQPMRAGEMLVIHRRGGRTVATERHHLP